MTVHLAQPLPECPECGQPVRRADLVEHVANCDTSAPCGAQAPHYGVFCDQPQHPTGTWHTAGTRIW